MISSSCFLVTPSFKCKLKGEQQLASVGSLLQVRLCAAGFIDIIFV